MTSGTILPSIGPPPPEFRRSFVPEHLRPKSLGRAAQEQPAAELVVRPEQKVASEKQNPESKTDTPADPQVPNTAIALGGASAVAVQVQEVTARQQQENSPPPSSKEQPLADELTDEERTEVQRLKERDREVRAHETAHATAGQGFTGTPSFEFATGPDGVRYAVGGHVDIDVAEVPDDPQATISKMEVVRAAALAPARPSGQDRAVAAAAATKAREAQAELSKQEKEAAAEIDEAKTATPNTRIAVAEGAQAVGGSVSSENSAAPLAQLQRSTPQPISINLVV